MLSPTLTPTRALRRHPLTANPRILLGVLLIALAVSGGLWWAGTVNQGRPVLVAARDLSVGTIVGIDDLAVTNARLDDRVYAAAIPAAEATTLIGRVVVEPVHANQQLVRAQIGAGPLLSGDEGAMTVAVKGEMAAGGRLQPGDQVQVIVTLDKGQPSARAEAVIERATIYAVGREDRTRFVGSTAGASGEVSATSGDTGGALASVTLIVTPEQRLALARAKWGGEIDLVLLPRAPRSGGGR